MKQQDEEEVVNVITLLLLIFAGLITELQLSSMSHGKCHA